MDHHTNFVRRVAGARANAGAAFVTPITTRITAGQLPDMAAEALLNVLAEP
uniref:hypothetical protein n=1 Tax=Mesorhizobium tianshanense TaxID=39844 RepID=UPI0012DCE300|nr:hypothetical protein [Mesorhizobium tianshanense]